MANKIPRRLVALSAAAIAAIYAAGFAVTRSADAGLAGSGSALASAPPTASTTSTTPASSAPTVVVGASAPATAARTSTAASAASSYKDGTYRGQGSSRRGGVSVAVTVQSGSITNVQITSVNTEYPVSRIASLPAAVVKQQTVNVNTISGATYSTQAFKQAVQQALALAQATNGPTTG
jgi:uncharacterized protein with FMN-binding domain